MPEAVEGRTGSRLDGLGGTVTDGSAGCGRLSLREETRHMSFYEQIAAGLDAEGIESRVTEDTLFVPIMEDLEVQFVTLDENLPAAEVYIAAADVDSEDDEFEAVLVSVVFSVEDAVEAVAHHVATDQVVALLRALLEGDDDRISDLDFEQDPEEATLLTAEVGETSFVQVLVASDDNIPTAQVRFITHGEDLDDLVDKAITEFWESDSEETLTEEDRRRIFADLLADQQELYSEVMDLGTFTDFTKLFDVLALITDHAEDWEEMLAPVDDGSEDFIDDDDEAIAEIDGEVIDVDTDAEFDDYEGGYEQDLDQE